MSVARTQLNEASQQITKQHTKATTTAIDNINSNHTAEEGPPQPPPPTLPLPQRVKGEIKVRAGLRDDVVDAPDPITTLGLVGQMIQTRSSVKAEATVANSATTCRLNGGLHETNHDRGPEQEREAHHEQQQQQQQQSSYNRPQKYCAVCGDKAIACNFNAVTCESCKAFFRRNAFKEQRLRCLFENRCVIDRVTRRFCSKCRLLKCFTIGMKREWILTDEQKQIKRVKIMQNKQSRNQLRLPPSQTPVDFESGSEATTPTPTRPTRPSSITSSLGGDQQNQLQINGGDTASKKRPLGANDMIDILSEHKAHKYQLVGQMIERRDAATECPDLGGGGGGGDQSRRGASGRHTLAHFCTLAHQCHFCSLKLAETTTTQTQTQHIPPVHPNYSLQQPHHAPPHLSDQNTAVAGYPAPHPPPPAPAPTDVATTYQLRPTPQTVACHSPSYYPSPQPVIVHHLGASPDRRPHHQVVATPQHPAPAPPASQYQARLQVPTSGPAATCCLSSVTWMQHRGDTGGICQVHNQQTGGCSGATSPRRLHVLESTRRQASGGSTSATCSLGCDDDEQGPPARGSEAVGVALADTPTGVDPIASGGTNGATDDGDHGDSADEGDEEEEEEGDEEGNEEEDEKESGKSGEATAAAATVEGQQVAETGKEILDCTANSEASSAADGEQPQEWRGEIYGAPAGSEPEIWARVERLGFSDTERKLVQEMIDATRLVFEPQERMANDTILDDIVYFCDAALRRLIKTVKQITAFRLLNMDDQIVLLKNACFKILLLRSSFHYVDDIEGWRDKSGAVLPLSKLKTEKCDTYTRHKAIMDKLAVPLRRDRLLMAFMILIILFDPTVSLKHANSVQLDNMLYLYTLRKYLVGTQPDPLAKYERIVEALQVINACNEEYNLFFARNYQPEEITPLLVEIFDISINDIPM